MRYKVKSDIESAVWHPKSQNHFVASLEDGSIVGFDMRNNKQPLFHFQAHKQACTQVCISPGIPNMMATCSQDETLKIWDIKDEPVLIQSK